MPIRVPNTYTRQRTLPGSLNAPQTDFRGVAAKTGALVDLGRMLQQRADELKKERDTTIARNAYNEFQEAARDKLYNEEYGLLNQTGEAIYNLDDQYSDWYGKFKSDYMAKRFDTNTQAQLFERAVDADSQRDLDSISKHIMREHETNKKRSIDNYMVGAEGQIRANPAITAEIAAKAKQEYDTTYPNTDNSIQHKMIDGRFWSAAVQETMAVDAGAALRLIEARKAELGAAYTDWKKKAEAENKKQLYNETIAEVRKLYPGDFNKQEDAIKAKGLDPKDERSLVSTIRGDETEARERENEFKRDQRDELLHNGVYGLVNQGKFGQALLALKNIPTDIVSEEERFGHQQRITNLMDNPADKDNNVAYDEWFGKIARDPGSVDPNMLLSDNRLTGGPNGTREKMYKWYLSRIKGDDSTDDKRLKPMLEVLKTKWNNKLYLSEDERTRYDEEPELGVKNQILFQQDKLRLVEWAAENPDASIFDYYGKEQVEEIQQVGWRERLRNKLFVEGTTPSGLRIAPRGQKPPIQPRSDISETNKKDTFGYFVGQEHTHPQTGEIYEYIGNNKWRKKR